MLSPHVVTLCMCMWDTEASGSCHENCAVIARTRRGKADPDFHTMPTYGDHIWGLFPSDNTVSSEG